MHAHSASDSALRLAIDVRRLPWMRRLALDYAFDFPRLAPFFAGDPSAASDWAAAIDRARGCARPRVEIAAMIAAQQARRGAPPAAVESAARLAEPGAVAIATGQQAGLFGGPLFTFLKALTTIRLAARISRDHGVPVVPVFWIDAEDHDWNEVRGCTVFDDEWQPRGVQAAPIDGAGERPIGSLVWNERIADTVEALAASLPDTEFRSSVVDLIRGCYAPGRSVADSFARLLEGLLGGLGLVVFDASDPAAKPFVAHVFASELERAGQTALLAARAGAELRSRGYHMQVTPHPDHAALFDTNGGRRLIQADGDGFAIEDDGRVPRAELIARARQHPEHFSPNVLLRPVVQDTLFPTICYVSGPNELAYLAQLKAVYDAFTVPMPLVVPRATATLLDAPGLRFLTRYRVPFEALQAQDEQALNELLRTMLPPGVERTLQDASTAITERMDAVIGAVPAVDPTLEGKARSVLGRMQHELETLHAKVLQAAKRRDDTLRRQFTHAQAQAFPHGEPQERAISGISFVARYGPGLIARLADDLPLDAGTHWIVTV